MKYNQEFTKEQFLEIPTFDVETLNTAPFDVPILITAEQRAQKEAVLQLIEKLGADGFNKFIDENHETSKNAGLNQKAGTPKMAKGMRVDFCIKRHGGKKSHFPYYQTVGGHLVKS